MLQCHPDVHLMTTAKKVNLRAIQNLNAYMDTLQSIALGKFTAMKPHDSRLVEIDFILKLEGQHRHSKRNSKSKKDAGSSSRRKVELLLPPFQLCRELASGGSIQNSSLRQRLHEHSRRELVKLLRMAGLNIPPDHSMNAVEAGHPYSWDTALGFAFRDDYRSSEAFYSPPDETDDHDGGFRRAHFDHRSRPKTAYETSRDRFTTNIQWHNYDKLYAQAVAEMNADAATEGLVQKHAGRRRAMIAGILANARILQQQQQSPPTFDQDGSSSSSSGISFVEQLVAFRRLSLLLDQNFEALQMEEFGAMWESCRIVLTESRPFNVSSSALHKKRARNAATGSGFSFTLHPDMSVTIHVPIDFRDEELIQELDRNVWDFYNFIDDGMDELLPDQGS